MKIKYNGGKNESYVLKNRDKYIPVFIEDITAEFKDIVAEEELEIDIFGRIVTKNNK